MTALNCSEWTPAGTSPVWPIVPRPATTGPPPELRNTLNAPSRLCGAEKMRATGGRDPCAYESELNSLIVDN